MKSVLIVDDKEENRYYLSALLKSHGWQVESATDGGGALQLAKRKPPDLVISDLLMPVMDGYTLLRRWRSDPDLRSIPFVVYTATYSDPEDRQLALDMGADAFILKPLAPDEFIARIKEVQQPSAERKSMVDTNRSSLDDTLVLRRYNETLVRKLEDKSEKLEQANQALEQDLRYLRQVDKKIQFTNLILRTQQENSLDAILVVDEGGKILSFNRHFVDLWNIPEETLQSRLDEAALKVAVQKIENQDVFLSQVQYLYKHPDKKSRDELLLKDGRIIDRYSAPAIGTDNEYFGRIWYFRDITRQRQTELLLKEGEARYRTLFDSMLEGVAYCRGLFVNGELEDFVYQDVNPAFEQITGLKRAIGQRVSSLLPTLRNTNPEIFAAFSRVAKTGQSIKFESYIKPLRQWQSIAVYSQKQEHFVVVFDDITQRKETAERILYLNRVHAMLTSINALLIRANNQQELFDDACDIALRIGGFKMALICRTDPQTQDIDPVAFHGHHKVLMDEIKHAFSSIEDRSKTFVGRATREKRFIIVNDIANDPTVFFPKEFADADVHSLAVFPLIVSGQSVGAMILYAKEVDFFHGEEVDLLMGLTQDISFAIDHLEKQERLHYLAYYDQLTGLANRELFLERVDQQLRSSLKRNTLVGVLTVDLERFKVVNEGLGRGAGDALLIEVANWLRNELGEEQLLARVDADRFAIVLPEATHTEDIARRVDQLLRRLQQQDFQINRISIHPVARAGIALFPSGGHDAKGLFNQSEAALKSAKEAKVPYLFHEMEMSEAMARRLSLENQLRQALKRNEFVLHYQPKFSSLSGHLTGAEALIRWQNPQAGLVSPGEFVPILEETGLIHEVGRWALIEAVNTALKWISENLPAVRIAVNVSPLQLRNPNFPQEVAEAIGADQAGANTLEFEITESILMENVKHHVSTLNELRSLGVRIAIDDFGTGFSSLSYLSTLPIDTVKIDRSFISLMVQNPRDQTLVRTIIQLAHSFSLNSVAEGVETREQLELLQTLGCDETQGFLHSPALPRDEFEKRFLRTTSR